MIEATCFGLNVLTLFGWHHPAVVTNISGRFLCISDRSISLWTVSIVHPKLFTGLGFRPIIGKGSSTASQYGLSDTYESGLPT